MQSRILFILHFPPPLNGASFMGKFIKESSLINETFESDFINLTTSFSLEKKNKASLKKLIIIIGILLNVVKGLIKKRYDLCYMTLSASGSGFYKDLLIVCILKLFGKKIIYHFHNKGVANAGKNKFNDFLFRFVFKNTKSILITPLLYSDIRKYVKEDDVFYCPNGIAREESWIAPDKPVNKDVCRLLFLSNIMKEKGVYVLLDACKQLKAKQLSFECHFVGAWVDITENEYSSYVLKNNLADIVFAHGPRYNEDKFSFLRNSDVFVFPTYYHFETFGLVNLEAMQCGLPIVSTREGGIPDVVLDGVTGFLVPQKDVQALADKLEILITQPDLRLKMGMSGQRRFNEFFTFEIFEKNLNNILKLAIDGNIADIKPRLLKDLKQQANLST